MKTTEIPAENSVFNDKNDQINADKKTLFACWSFSEDTQEFICTDSFAIDDPIPFKDMNFFSAKRCQKTLIYRSLSDEVFWFSLNS